MASLQSHPSQVAVVLEKEGGGVERERENDPHSLPQAQHSASSLWDWRGETVESHERGCVALLEALCAYLAS